MPRYSITPGRILMDGDRPIVGIHRYVESGNGNMSPHDCDRLAHHIAKLLNEHPLPARRK